MVKRWGSSTCISNKFQIMLMYLVMEPCFETHGSGNFLAIGHKMYKRTESVVWNASPSFRAGGNHLLIFVHMRHL